jgi:ribosome-binding protein aMBF1 (putative translation factor)
MIKMVKLSELRTADEIHEQDMRDLDYRREYERTRLANDVAIKVIAYRAQRGLSQAQLARQVGMRQPHIARLEAGDHEPSLATLARLADALNLDFSVEVKRDRMRLRHPARVSGEPGAQRDHGRKRA